jgi:hypothetical protein
VYIPSFHFLIIEKFWILLYGIGKGVIGLTSGEEWIRKKQLNDSFWSGFAGGLLVGVFVAGFFFLTGPLAK